MGEWCWSAVLAPLLLLLRKDIIQATAGTLERMRQGETVAPASGVASEERSELLCCIVSEGWGEDEAEVDDVKRSNRFPTARGDLVDGR
jgi:hypothetical protein